MPALEVCKAEAVIVSKRGQGTGHTGIENPLLHGDNARTPSGDAKASVDEPLGGLAG